MIWEKVWVEENVFVLSIRSHMKTAKTAKATGSGYWVPTCMVARAFTVSL
jgi:hypothetical protein